MQEITEGKTAVRVPETEHVSKKMQVFYNPVMKLNRDLSLLVLSTMERPKIALPMEATGVRAARICNELDIRAVMHVNDLNPNAIELAKDNIEPMRGDTDVEYHSKDASIFLREEKPFDYIDIDPFGSPNQFLDAAVQAIRQDGIVAVTATDTSALAGTYQRTTARKYWSRSSRTWAMHDIGLRILIRKVQLVAAQYTLAAHPLISVARDHYYRIFFRFEKGADPVKEVLSEHGYLHVDTGRASIQASGKNTGEEVAGPLWLGPLHDKGFVEEVGGRTAQFPDTEEILFLIREECAIATPGFLDIHTLCSTYGMEPPKRDLLLDRLGAHAARTHISPTGFKTDLAVDDIVAVLEELSP